MRMDRDKQKEPPVPISTKEAILQAATELFSTEGFAGTSMSDLAQTLGLSKAGIYHHFESKESIFQTLLQSTYEDLKELVAQHKRIPASQIERLEILRQFAEFMFKHRSVVRLALSEMPGEVKTHKSQGQVFMFRLQQLIAGKNPTSEEKVRARIALGIIFLGIVPSPHEVLPDVKDVDLELMLKIASEALGVSG